MRSRSIFSALSFGLGWMVILGWFSPSEAVLRPNQVFTANSKKTEAYIRDGLIVGGDRAVDQVVIRDIRRAANPGFERLVIDLEGSRNGEPLAIDRPPYYQVAVNLDEKRLIFTLWGSPKLAFHAQKTLQAFKKSPAVDTVELLPQVEPDRWTFAVNLKSGKSVEVFELSNPIRIITDIKIGALK